MNKEEPFRNQAERLKQRIEKINEETTEIRDQFPPREQVHREKRNKTKWKLKYPVIRILVLFFILLPIVIFSAYSYLEEGKGKGKGTEKVSGSSSGYEVINFEKSDTKSNVDKKDNNDDNLIEENVEEAVEVQQPITEDTPTENPASDKNSGTSTETPAPQPEKPAIIYHTVKKGDNLYRIALKYYHSKAGEEIIRKANNIRGDEIYLGQVLEIPLNK